MAVADITMWVQVSKADMQPAKTEAMLRGQEGQFDDSARGGLPVLSLARTSVTDHRNPGPGAHGLDHHTADTMV